MAQRVVHYKKLYAELSARISNGDICGKLPSIAELIREFDVSHNTVKKVLDQLKQAGLIHGVQGKGCYTLGGNKTGRARQVGVWASNLEMLNSSFYVNCIAVMRSILLKHNVVTKYYDIFTLPDVAELDALVVIDHVNSGLKQLLENNIGGCRVIQVNISYFDNFTSVNSDNYSCGYQAMKYLYDHGHRKIGVLARELDFHFFKQRWAGAERFAEAHDDLKLSCVELSCDIICEKSPGIAAAEATYGMLAQMPDITAVFAFTDVLSLGVLSALQQSGLRVPQDVSLISVDNREFAPLTNPPLTSFAEDAEGIGKKVAAIILDESSDSNKVENYAFVPHLIVRKSVRNIAID